MYLWLTERCNMRCAHCCNSATEKGRDISIELAEAAIDMAEKHGCYISFGGGEPTLHPNFWEIIMYAVSKENIKCLWMATNGSQTNIALALTKLAKKGVLGVALSQDGFHDPIDPKVILAFSKKSSYEPYPNSFHNTYPATTDCREIRAVGSRLIKAGRCKEGDKRCICNDLQVLVDGRITLCGCKRSPVIGNVSDKDPLKWYYIIHENFPRYSEYESCWFSLSAKDRKYLARCIATNSGWEKEK